MKTLTATRYVTPLREGGSLPAVVEASDGRLYVAKFRGAGQGTRALVAEWLAGELARACGLAVPGLVRLELDEAFGRNEPDPEIRDLLRASTGANLGLAFLPGAISYDPIAPPEVDAALASAIVWFDCVRHERGPHAPQPEPAARRGRVCGSSTTARRFTSTMRGRSAARERLQPIRADQRPRAAAAGRAPCRGGRGDAREAGGCAARADARGAARRVALGARRAGRPGGDARGLRTLVRRAARGAPTPSTGRRRVPDRRSFEYAVVRVVPRVERGECLNAGVIVWCRSLQWLGARVDAGPHAAGGARARRRRGDDRCRTSRASSASPRAARTPDPSAGSTRPSASAGWSRRAAP